MSFIPWFNRPRAFWGFPKDNSSFTRFIVYHHLWPNNFAHLEAGVDVVAELAADVHARSHRWALGLNIPGGGDCQDKGGGNVSTFYAKHRSLISLAVGTSLVTAYFTSKATFVQMFKCCEQDGARQAELIKL